MKVKYPRTFHLPWSPGKTNDDKVMKSLTAFEGKEIVVTEKMDGENTTLYRHSFHARSLDSRHHPSRDWIAGLWGSIAHAIPEEMRVCGENLYAKHSLAYDDLKSYFYGFSVWESDVCLSWDETMWMLDELGITPVPVIYRGPFSLSALIDLSVNFNIKKHEGFVVRVADEFEMDDFNKYVGKWVRPGHVVTEEHWMHSEIVPNKVIG